MKHAPIVAVFIASLAAWPASAQQPEHQDGQPGAAQNDQSRQHSRGTAMQDSEAMQQHREQMQQMRKIMQLARVAEDPEERARLLAQHQTMMGSRMAAMMGDCDRAPVKDRCQQYMTMMYDMLEQMSARQGLEQHNWGSPAPDEQ